MFSIIITEKGGTERRESYDRTEINVGRVQGNDLMLPKGNVSKRHARLLFRDGRFIVTDLKSTNGTYVNGRKIAQATIVREGDKIYIGDFVLRIEMPGGAAASQDALPAASSGAGQPSPPIGEPASDSGEAARPSPNAAPPPPPPLAVESQPLASPRISSHGAAPPSPPSAIGPDGVSHFPLERDPDEGAYGSVPSPPRVPSAASTGGPARATSPPVRPSAHPIPAPAPLGGPTLAAPPPAPPSAVAAPPSASTPQPPAMVQALAPMPAPRIEPAAAEPSRSGSGLPLAPPSQSSALVSAVPPPNAAAFPPIPPSAQRRSPSSEDRLPSGDAARASARRQLVTSLVERVEGKVDLRSIAKGEPVPQLMAGTVDRGLRDVAAAMGDAAPPAAELEPAIADAKREILELGPLGALLDDEDVTEIQIVRHDHLVSMVGRKTVVSEIAFSTEASLDRVLRRLCVRAGKPLEPGEAFVDRRLERGARVFAVVSQPSGGGSMITIRKPQRADQTLDDLVRAGAVSRVVASFLAQAVAAHANILVTGGFGSGATTVLGALAAAGSTDDRVIVLSEDDEIVFNQPHTVSILLGDTAEAGARAVRAALRAHPDRLVVAAFAGHVVTEVIDAVGDGIEGVMAAARAPTLRHLAARLPADVAATRGGVPLEVAREWLASAFDLVVEVAKLRDGRMRVLRVGELVSEGGQLQVRDVFAFVVERIAAGGAVEGSFAATGHVPRVAEDLAQRGAALDPSFFKPTSKGGGGPR